MGLDLLLNQRLDLLLNPLFLGGVAHEKILLGKVGEVFEEGIFQFERVIGAFGFARRADERVGGDELEVEIGKRRHAVIVGGGIYIEIHEQGDEAAELG
ncbi:MAG: hypothetical protein PHG96_13080, partial [Kiritimatiellae bacterium]|nr:hypothetical protein [Kiritimatiellia bacterium]